MPRDGRSDFLLTAGRRIRRRRRRPVMKRRFAVQRFDVDLGDRGLVGFCGATATC